MVFIKTINVFYLKKKQHKAFRTSAYAPDNVQTYEKIYAIYKI